MSGRIVFVVSMVAVPSLLAAPASAQYKTHVEVTGGPHAGTYEFGGGYGRTPSDCSLARDSTGFGVIATTNRQTNGQQLRATNVTVTVGDAANGDFNTTSFRLAIQFSGPGGGQPSTIRFDGMGTMHPPDAGTFTFNLLGNTFTSAFSGATTDGTEHIRFTGTIACKGFNGLL